MLINIVYYVYIDQYININITNQAISFFVCFFSKNTHECWGYLTLTLTLSPIEDACIYVYSTCRLNFIKHDQRKLWEISTFICN